MRASHHPQTAQSSPRHLIGACTQQLGPAGCVTGERSVSTPDVSPACGDWPQLPVGTTTFRAANVPPQGLVIRRPDPTPCPAAYAVTMTEFLQALTWPRRTARLELRPATQADGDAIVALFANPNVTKWLPRQEAGARLRWDAGEPVPTTVVALCDGEIVGFGAVKPSDGWAQEEVDPSVNRRMIELGWTLDPRVQGQGFGTELARELLSIAFELGARRVIAQCFADNIPSWKVMERLGMRREAHHVKESLHRDLGWVDGYLYAMLREEYDELPR